MPKGDTCFSGAAVARTAAPQTHLDTHPTSLCLGRSTERLCQPLGGGGREKVFFPSSLGDSRMWARLRTGGQDWRDPQAERGQTLLLRLTGESFSLFSTAPSWPQQRACSGPRNLYFSQTPRATAVTYAR